MGVVTCGEARSDTAIVAISLPLSCRNFLKQLLHRLVRYVVRKATEFGWRDVEAGVGHTAAFRDVGHLTSPGPIPLCSHLTSDSALDRRRTDGLPFVRLANAELVIRDDSAVIGENQELESDRGHRSVVHSDHLPLNLHRVVMSHWWLDPAKAIFS
jgi:hypothetical protein